MVGLRLNVVDIAGVMAGVYVAAPHLLLVPLYFRLQFEAVYGSRVHEGLGELLAYLLSVGAFEGSASLFL